MPRTFRLGQVWNDACDEGFTIVSVKTGREIVMVHNHRNVVDGDILWDDFIPASKADRALFSVRIYND